MQLCQSQQVRGLAIKRKGGKRRVQATAGHLKNMPLINEDLVRVIMERCAKSGAKSPDQVQLRLVIEQSPQPQQQQEPTEDDEADDASQNQQPQKQPPKSETTTLAKAIQTSLDLGLDLVEIDLNHDLPVVRAVDFDSKLYQMTKAAKEKATTDTSSIQKEFRFKARTADFDLIRKIDKVRESLEKGYKCRIMATCPARMVGKTPETQNGALHVLERVVEGVADLGQPLRDPELNTEKTHANTLLIPSKWN